MKSGARALLAGLIFWASVASGTVRPNHLFSNHMVLQSGKAVPVWGTADSGEAVTVTFNGQHQSATAGADGKWMVKLELLSTGGPFEMTIAGKNSITIQDVLVGEVWIGSGQSNMQFPVGASSTVKAYNGVTNLEEEVAAADYPQIRMYKVKTALSAEPAGGYGWDLGSLHATNRDGFFGHRLFFRERLAERAEDAGRGDQFFFRRKYR